MRTYHSSSPNLFIHFYSMNDLLIYEFYNQRTRLLSYINLIQYLAFHDKNVFFSIEFQETC